MCLNMLERMQDPESVCRKLGHEQKEEGRGKLIIPVEAVTL